MHYSIRNVANKMGVSKTAIQQYINKNSNKFYQKHLQKYGNKFLIDQTGFNIIGKHYKNRKHNRNNYQQHFNNIADRKLIKYLKNTNNKQYMTIKKLQSNLQTQQKLTDQQQQLQLSSQQEIKRLRLHIKEITGPKRHHHGFIWKIFH